MDFPRVPKKFLIPRKKIPQRGDFRKLHTIQHNKISWSWKVATVHKSTDVCWYQSSKSVISISTAAGVCLLMWPHAVRISRQLTPMNAVEWWTTITCPPPFFDPIIHLLSIFCAHTLWIDHQTLSTVGVVAIHYDCRSPPTHLASAGVKVTGDNHAPTHAATTGMDHPFHMGTVHASSCGHACYAWHRWPQCNYINGHRMVRNAALISRL